MYFAALVRLLSSPVSCGTRICFWFITFTIIVDLQSQCKKMAKIITGKFKLSKARLEGKSKSGEFIVTRFV